MSAAVQPSTELQSPPLGSTRRRPSQVLASDYHLDVRQQPRQARMAGSGEKADRRPIDPPPIIRLRIRKPHARDVPEEHLSDEDLVTPTLTHTLFMFASLIPENSEEELYDITGSKSKLVAGSVVSSLFHLKDESSFVFPDLSVRTEGRWRFKLSLFELGEDGVTFCNAIITDVFQVYSSKRFPGMGKSTELSKSFAQQGLKLRIRRPGSKAVNDDNDDDPTPRASGSGASKKASSRRSSAEDNPSGQRSRRTSDEHSAGEAARRPYAESSVGPAGPTTHRHAHAYAPYPPRSTGVPLPLQAPPAEHRSYAHPPGQREHYPSRPADYPPGYGPPQHSHQQQPPQLVHQHQHQHRQPVQPQSRHQLHSQHYPSSYPHSHPSSSHQQQQPQHHHHHHHHHHVALPPHSHSHTHPHPHSHSHGPSHTASPPLPSSSLASHSLSHHHSPPLPHLPAVSVSVSSSSRILPPPFTPRSGSRSRSRSPPPILAPIRSLPPPASKSYDADTVAAGAALAALCGGAERRGEVSSVRSTGSEEDELEGKEEKEDVEMSSAPSSVPAGGGGGGGGSLAMLLAGSSCAREEEGKEDGGEGGGGGGTTVDFF